MDRTQFLLNDKNKIDNFLNENEDNSNDLDEINSIDEMSRKVGIEGLYYITHFNNVSSILEQGILFHSQVEKKQIQYTSIYNTQIIDRRANRMIGENQSLWDFANLYFQPRNAMLYSLIYKTRDAIHEIAILGIKKTILSSKKKIFITTGNAASHESEIIPMPQGKKILGKIRNQIDNDWWNKEDGSKRKIMAECLVPERVTPSFIQAIYVASDRGKNKLETLLSSCSSFEISKIPIIVEPQRFFQPVWREKLANTNISLVRGDIFFSRMQTLTISVNCVGVMGKGLASTAKYRFPDVYVRYEALCKNKTLKLGQPYLYKRESSAIDDLYDEAFSIADLDDSSQTWFLLFPTKDHWRNKSTLMGIEQGLQWLSKNYKTQGILSLAIPALGCGLGGLSWEDVGPLMCKYLVCLDIPVALYLPTESELPKQFLSNDFLLSQVDF